MKQTIPEGIILIGAGGHALSVAEAAKGSLPIAGYISHAENPAMTGKWFGDDSVAREISEAGYRVHMAFVYAGLPVMERRRRLISLYEEAGASFATVIAPTAVVTPNSSVADGCAVLNGAIVNRAIIGKNSIVNSGAIVEHDSVIGTNTFIGPGAVVGGGVTIGDDCFIGLGARIINGATICPGVTVAMGGIVNRSLTEPGIYHGFPLKLHKRKR